MAVPVVGVWHMGVAVRDRRVLVPMAVGARGHGVVYMGVVPIVVPVGMFMFQCVVGVLVGMGFRQVQHNPQQHHHTGSDHQSAA